MLVFFIGSWLQFSAHQTFARMTAKGGRSKSGYHIPKGICHIFISINMQRFALENCQLIALRVSFGGFPCRLIVPGTYLRLQEAHSSWCRAPTTWGRLCCTWALLPS